MQQCHALDRNIQIWMEALAAFFIIPQDQQAMTSQLKAMLGLA